MKSIVRFTLIAGLLAGSSLLTRAEDPAPATPAAAPAAKKAHSAATSDAKKLTPEQRKARADERLKALRAKKAAGKLTEKESQQLERLEKRATEPAAHTAARTHKAAPEKSGDAKADSQGAKK